MSGAIGYLGAGGDREGDRRGLLGSDVDSLCCFLQGAVSGRCVAEAKGGERGAGDRAAKGRRRERASAGGSQEPGGSLSASLIHS